MHARHVYMYVGPVAHTKQVYLLTPMDHATLLNAKSTISHYPPSLGLLAITSVD